MLLCSNTDKHSSKIFACSSRWWGTKPKQKPETIRTTKNIGQNVWSPKLETLELKPKIKIKANNCFGYNCREKWWCNFAIFKILLFFFFLSIFLYSPWFIFKSQFKHFVTASKQIFCLFHTLIFDILSRQTPPSSVSLVSWSRLLRGFTIF